MGNAFLGQGTLLMDRLTSAGVATGLIEAGNATTFSIQPDSETKELTGKGRDNYGQSIASATIPKPSKLNITLNELDKNVLAIAFQGEDSVVNEAAGTVIDEVVTMYAAGRYADLAHRNIAETPAVTVEKKAGVDAPVRTSTKDYEVGDVVIPVSANSHYYKCTVGGASGSSVPTWPTDGTTVTDGTVTWLDMGLIEVPAADYEINYRMGIIKPVNGGSIQSGDEVNISYSYNAVAGSKITGATQPIIKCRLVLDGKNYNDGKDCRVEVYEATLRPTKAINFLSDDYETVDLEGTMITPSGKASPFIVELAE